MKEIKPYLTANEALTGLDNGGRFYNFLTEEGDGVISEAELTKVAGWMSTKQSRILLLALSMSKLDEASKELVFSKLDEESKAHLEKYNPIKLDISEVVEKGVLGTNIIVTGTPRHLRSGGNFTGFVLIPAGSVLMPMPIHEVYDVYEISDSQTQAKLLLAETINTNKLPAENLLIGGILKEHKPNDVMSPPIKYLEIHYFIKL